MSIQFSFLETEYIPQGKCIILYSPRLLHRQAKRHAVELLQGEEKMEIEISIDGHSLQITTNNLLSGIYRLVLRHLVDTNSENVNDREISKIVRVQKICGHVPPNFRVLRVLHLAVGELRTTRLRPEEDLPDGTYHLTVLRGMYSNGHKVNTMAFDEAGKQVDYHDVLNGIEQRRGLKFGSLDEKLWHKLNTEDSNEISVSIWPKLDHPHCGNGEARLFPGTHKSELETPMHISAFQRPKASLVTILERLGAQCHHHSDFPHVTATLNRRQITTLSKHKDVEVILLNAPTPDIRQLQDQSQPLLEALNPSPALEEPMTINRGKGVKELGPNFRGKGVSVAVWENNGQKGPFPFVPFKGIFNEADLKTPANPPNNEDDHARQVASIIKNTMPLPHNPGFAPDCEIYYANFSPLQPPLTELVDLVVLKAEKALKWALEQGCSVINMSFRLGASVDGHMDQYDRLVDWIATTPPYPFIVAAAGNHPIGGFRDFVDHLFYNGMTVGNHNKAGTETLKSSIGGNPPPQAFDHDRELPDISACGHGVRVVEKWFVTGTSFSCPAVAGTAAVLHGLQPILRHSPEAVRAILYASCGRRVGHPLGDGPGWWDSINHPDGHQRRSPFPDLFDGAGMLDVFSAVRIALNRVHGVSEEVCVGSGWSLGFLQRTLMSDLRKSPYVFKVRVPGPRVTTGPQKLIRGKAALAWNSWTLGSTAVSKLAMRLDLAVYKDGAVDFETVSTSFDNNYEIAEWNAISGADYKIFILFQDEDPEVPSTKSPWFGIAWQFFENGVSML